MLCVDVDMDTVQAVRRQDCLYLAAKKGLLHEKCRIKPRGRGSENVLIRSKISLYSTYKLSLIAERLSARILIVQCCQFAFVSIYIPHT